MGEPFPVGASRIVAVDVCVDHAREDVEPGCVDRLARAALEIGPDGCDQTVGNADVAGPAPGFGDHATAANEKVERAQGIPSHPKPRLSRIRMAPALQAG